jgi:hypothetical protein
MRGFALGAGTRATRAQHARRRRACGAWRISGARDVFSCFFHTRYAPQCSLGETVKPGRSVLKVQASGKNCVLASLMADKIESSVLELMFEEVGASHVWLARNRNARLATRRACAPFWFARHRRESSEGRACMRALECRRVTRKTELQGEVEFSVSGPNEIHLAGNMLDNDDPDDMGGMMGGDDDDEEEDDEEDDEDEEEDAPPQTGGKKAPAAKPTPQSGKKAPVAMEEDDDDDEEDDEDEGDEDEGDEDEDDDQEGEDDDDEDEDDDEEEEEQVGKKRAAPAGKPAPQSATKQQKTPAKATPGKVAGKDAGSAAKSSPMASPRGGVCVFYCYFPHA